MVNSINGTLTFRTPEQIGLETGGVEWAIDSTATSISALPGKGETVRIYTYLHHTQDQMKLYGFLTMAERRVFLSLLTVNGVGPSLARKILSGTTPERFEAAVNTEDLAALGSIPGLGKKTAQKIVLHLRGKLADDPVEAAGPVSEVVEALTAMGFDAKGVGKAVTEVLSDPGLEGLSDDDREKEVLRRAIIALSS